MIVLSESTEQIEASASASENKLMAELKEEYRQKIEAEAIEQGAWYENLTFFVTGRKA
ncbi:MAG: hypothetical protein V7K41_08770 [Nostoc sp.]|uniref:hypothetical protein n=1 Tax=Nostoc sp. TaxID=1180 RepID=UPI002FF8505D